MNRLFVWPAHGTALLILVHVFADSRLSFTPLSDTRPTAFS
jgi:hypothetical protein